MRISLHEYIWLCSYAGGRVCVCVCVCVSMCLRDMCERDRECYCVIMTGEWGPPLYDLKVLTSDIVERPKNRRRA